MASQTAQRIIIKGGRIVDPATGLDATGDVVIEDGRVVTIGGRQSAIGNRQSGEQVIDAEALIVCPGLIDPHVHLREPSPPVGELFHHEETIASGASASINGGFTTVCCMPNTRPPLDTVEMVRFVHERAAAADQARVFVVACATKGRAGRELSSILTATFSSFPRRREPRGDTEKSLELDSRLRGNDDTAVPTWFDSVGFTDDGDVVADPAVMEQVLRACKEANKCFMQHCQEPSLTVGASMNAGAVAERLGEIGWPREAEEMIVERDIKINRTIGAHYHAQHLSSGGSAQIIRQARAEGLPVSGEVSPHHLLLTEEDIARAFRQWAIGNGQSDSADVKPNAECRLPIAFLKMNPPLRSQADINLLKHAVADGTITVLGTDHAPHPLATKTIEFAKASFGIVGLDCALPLYAKALIEDGVIGWPRMIAMMTVEPARLCGLDRLGLGMLKVGGLADVTLIDPTMQWQIQAEDFRSMGRNCPFEGWNVKGRAVGVIVGGQVKMSRLGDRIREWSAPHPG